jgi:ATP-dependent RNA helicase DDX3X
VCWHSRLVFHFSPLLVLFLLLQGSGKTAGFLFPIIMSMIKSGGQQPPEGARRRVYPEALVLAPTRELASQIQDEANKFTYCTGIASVVVYGGAEVREQLRQIERGCDLLVATPGRLVDLIERGRLAMDNVRFLVLDEAGEFSFCYSKL